MNCSKDGINSHKFLCVKYFPVYFTVMEISIVNVSSEPESYGADMNSAETFI